MRQDEVPQDQESTHAGIKKLLYAVDDQGQYVPTGSQGWEAEAYATRLAVSELEALAETAVQEWQQGQASPLKYLMYQHRLDLTSLAQATGFWQWRIRRHLRPSVYSKLPLRLLQRYAEVFGMDVQELIQLQNRQP
ncbi:MAG: hypothetical protein IBX50_09075 [Marinospirillum sp.]|uniref:hypothetical protein n=1 Tax=Marinospirillum sp. TaxID=2183934 RepID=UPI001A0C3200|nr:hypothetical protein [Marinospirillum sp.]MBE0506855.1 hypothetical protein [Marinospirillum sp.]